MPLEGRRLQLVSQDLSLRERAIGCMVFLHVNKAGGETVQAVLRNVMPKDWGTVTCDYKAYPRCRLGGKLTKFAVGSPTFDLAHLADVVGTHKVRSIADDVGLIGFGGYTELLRGSTLLTHVAAASFSRRCFKWTIFRDPATRVVSAFCAPRPSHPQLLHCCRPYDNTQVFACLPHPPRRLL